MNPEIHSKSNSSNSKKKYIVKARGRIDGGGLWHNRGQRWRGGRRRREVERS